MSSKSLLGNVCPGMPRRRRLGLAAVSALMLASFARADDFDDWVELLYRPFQAEQVSLSPDGQHVAYTVHGKEGLILRVLDITNPWSKVDFNVAEDREVAFSKERAPAQLQFIGWANAKRLVFAPTEEVYGSKRITPIFAANADGTDAKEIANAYDFSDQIMQVSMGSAGGGGDTSDASASGGGGGGGGGGGAGDGGDGGGDNTPNFKYVMREIRLLGFSAKDRNQLLVEAIGEKMSRRATQQSPTAVFKIDITTGKNAELDEELNQGRFYYDMEGKARLLSYESQYSDSHTYRFLDPNGGRWRDLQGDWTGIPAAAWMLTPKNYYEEHAYPLGVDFDPDRILVATNVGRDTFAIEALNLRTKQRALVAEHPHLDLAPLEPGDPRDTLVFDEYSHQLVGVRAATGFAPTTVWTDPELAEVQRLVDRKLPWRAVEILQWSQARDRFLVRVTGSTEPGRYYVFDRKAGLFNQFLRRAPWLPVGQLHEVRSFEFDTAAGVHLTGYVTIPRKPRINPPPVIVDFPSGFPGRVTNAFDREAQMLAELGLMVVRVNHRGTNGFGRAHRNAVQAGLDRVPIEDALATIEWLSTQYKIDRRRIATMGEGFGGYLALRALQLKPDIFRCGIAVDAPIDPQRWVRPKLSDEDTVDFAQEVQRGFLEKSAVPLRDLSVLQHPDQITKPVFLMVTNDPDKNAEIIAENDSLRSALKHLGNPAEYLEVGEDFTQQLPKARAAAYRRLDEFFNLSLYHYTVNVGETKVVK
jgi:pimeloyl-ACP methyl ester carboxylesterase